MLTDRIKELIARARIVSFASWDAHPADSIAIFQAAEDNRVYLTDDDYAKIEALSPQTSTLIPIAQLLRDRVVEIVDEARKHHWEQQRNRRRGSMGGDVDRGRGRTASESR